jgi:hypothetical protein
MFQLTGEESAELEALRSKNVTLIKGRGQHRKYLPYVFTEQGIAMLSSVLGSDRAIDVNIQIMRTFVKLREMIASNRVLPGVWMIWKRSTTPSSGWCSTPSAA